jgi:hypothetical protein
MTYRSDHDAALARLDALEAENARLVAENERLRAPKTPPQVVPASDPSFSSKITLALIGVLATLSFAMIAYLLIKGDG